MQVPVRVVDAARLRVDPPVLVALAATTVVFTATPFLIGPVADEYDVTRGAAGLVSAGQLAGFVVSSWVAGRFFRPVRRVFVWIGALGVVANIGSAVAPTFETLVAARAVSGLSLGLAAWFAWQAAFGNPRKTGDTAVVGPLIGMASPPLVALLVEGPGLRPTFVVLAVVAALPLALAHRVDRVDKLRPHRTRHAATPAARLLLLALMLLTMGGSSVFIFAATIGTDEVGVSATVVSLIFSVNALLGIPAAKWTRRRGPAAAWFAAIAVLAYLLGAVHATPVFVGVLAIWGFFFFMATPSAFAILAARSNFPEERAGDAQAVMALGRVFGPAVGGALLAADRAALHGLVAAALVGIAAVAVLAVERGVPSRYARLPAVSPRS